LQVRQGIASGLNTQNTESVVGRVRVVFEGLFVYP
jgi:hypothetical protein